MIIFTGSQVSYFAGNLHTQKLNKAQTKRANIMGVQYFREIWYFSRINRSRVNFVLSFILSSFYFLVICMNFPFCFLLFQNTLPPLLILDPIFIWKRSNDALSVWISMISLATVTSMSALSTSTSTPSSPSSPRANLNRYSTTSLTALLLTSLFLFWSKIRCSSSDPFLIKRIIYDPSSLYLSSFMWRRHISTSRFFRTHPCWCRFSCLPLRHLFTIISVISSFTARVILMRPSSVSITTGLWTLHDEFYHISSPPPPPDPSAPTTNTPSASAYQSPRIYYRGNNDSELSPVRSFPLFGSTGTSRCCRVFQPPPSGGAFLGPYSQKNPLRLIPWLYFPYPFLFRSAPFLQRGSPPPLVFRC